LGKKVTDTDWEKSAWHRARKKRHI